MFFFSIYGFDPLCRKKWRSKGQAVILNACECTWESGLTESVFSLKEEKQECKASLIFLD